MRKSFVYFAGDSKGIGYYILLKSIEKFPSPVIVFDDMDRLESVHKQYQISCPLMAFDASKSLPNQMGIYCIDTPCTEDDRIDTLNRLEQSALEANKRQLPLITGPVNKQTLSTPTRPFYGQTDFLANIFDVSNPQMLFYHHNLSLLLLTRHIPLKNVVNSLSIACIQQGIKDVLNYIQSSQSACQSIWITGINPHAGDCGLLGDEDKMIQEAIDSIPSAVINLYGPVAADTVLSRMQQHDIVISMYHDQLLPAIKALYPHALVNLSLNLPIRRLSVDHGPAIGTSYEDADPSSLITCIEYLQNHA